jgi:hypothetical protein
MDIDTEKARVEHIGLEGGDVLNPPVTTHMVEAMVEKINQAKEKCHHITNMYGALTLLDLIHTHIGFIFPKVFPCLLGIIQYPIF